VTPNPNPLERKDFGKSENPGCTSSCTKFPDLDRLSRIWPDLSETVRRAILEIAEASVRTSKGRSARRKGDRR